MKLSGEKVKLRALEPTDVNVLYKWENDTGIWRLSNTVAPFSKQVLEEYISNAHLDVYAAKQLRLMICDVKDKVVGCIDLFDFDPNNQRAGIGILVAENKDRNQGYASEALKLMIAYCFETLGLHQLYCNVTKYNKSSLELFKKHKFIVIGTKRDWVRDNRKFIDEYILQLINKK